MEEILASIRRIIADDQSLPGRPHADPAGSEPPPVEAAGSEAEVEAAPVDSVAGEERMHILRTPSPEASMSLESTQARDADASARRVHAPQFVSPDVPNLDLPVPPLALDAADTGSVEEPREAEPAATAPLGAEPSLAHGVPPHRAEAAAPADNLFSAAVDSSVTTAFNTLAASRLVANSDELMAIAGEMIRPLLKAWVEENLPNVIERLVSAEIERITRGGS